jgi:DNA-binding transcriptional regulator/RsmH inhibitor MraZ
VSATVTLDRKGRLLLPTRIRDAARLRVNARLVVRASGEGRVELLDPALLLRQAQEIGAQKRAGWKEDDHETTARLHELVERHPHAVT